MQPGVVSADFALLEPRKPAAAPSTSDQPATASTVQPMASAQLHIVGSVTDMSANWSAKVAVNAAAQADKAQMAAVYQSMAATFLQSSLNLAAITAIRQFYCSIDTQPEPLVYEHFPTPLQPGAVRLVVLKPCVEDELVSKACQACQDILFAVPEGMQPHASKAESLHLTVFMTSQPGDPRPDPFVEGGGFDPSSPPVPIPAPNAATLQREIDICRSIACAARPAFEVQSVVFANTGTLLLCLVDTTGQLASMRQKIREALPGASVKQSSIMHMTLGRVLNPRQLTLEERQTVQDRCSHWTQQLKGMPFLPSVLWHVQEHQFTTVAGVQLPLPLLAK